MMASRQQLPYLVIKLAEKIIPNLGIKGRISFTLSKAKKALRESRGIPLIYFRPLH